MALESINYMESFFDKFGLMTGDGAVIRRMALGAIIGSLVITYIKPDYMFQNGLPRPWSALSNGSEELSATRVPWFAVPVGLAVLFGVFI